MHPSFSGFQLEQWYLPSNSKSVATCTGQEDGMVLTKGNWLAIAAGGGMLKVVYEGHGFAELSSEACVTCLRCLGEYFLEGYHKHCLF
jgi:hypothetical protein